MTTPTLNTDRLTLRPLTLQPDEIAAMHHIYRRPEAMRYLPYPPTTDPEATRSILARALLRGGSHHWVLVLHQTGAIIGYVTFIGGVRVPAMGYVIHPDYWGMGYTAEACRAALAFGFDTLAYDRVELWIEEANVQSQRVAQKLGFGLRSIIHTKDANHATYTPLYIYGLRAAAWRGQPDTPQSPTMFRAEPVLLTHDMAASVSFYADTLGFGIHTTWGDPVVQAWLSFGEWSGRMATLQLRQVDEATPIHTGGLVSIATDTGLMALYGRYRDKGVTIAMAPVDTAWGTVEFELLDNNGHALRFVCNR